MIELKGLALHCLLRFCHLLLTIETRRNRSGGDWVNGVLRARARLTTSERHLSGECRIKEVVDADLAAPEPEARLQDADFRRDYHAAFRSVFREFVLTRCKNPRGRRAAGRLSSAARHR